jgi:hypothetical protein
MCDSHAGVKYSGVTYQKYSLQLEKTNIKSSK